MGRRARARLPECPVARGEDAAKALSKADADQTSTTPACSGWPRRSRSSLTQPWPPHTGWSADISDDEVPRELLAIDGCGR